MADTMKANNQPISRTIKVIDTFLAPGNSKKKSAIMDCLELLKAGIDDDFISSMLSLFPK